MHKTILKRFKKMLEINAV